MNIFEKNLDYLKNNWPDVFDLIKEPVNDELEPDITYEKKDEYYLATRKNVRCFIQSRYSVSAELKNMFSEVPENTNQIMIFGFALGNSVQYALKRQTFPELKSLIIVEPSLKWFKIAMAQVNFAELFKEDISKITLLVGHTPEDSVDKVVKKIISLKENYFSVYHLPSRTLFDEYYRQLTDEIIVKLQTETMFARTDMQFLYLKVYNEILNSTLLACNFESIMDLFRGKRIIIVSSGPSLEKNINLLPEASKKAIIIAVGTAIRILDERGITPHFRIVADRFAEQTDIFQSLKNTKVPLIYNDPVYYGIPSGYEGNLIRLITTEDNFGKTIRKLKNCKIVPFLSGTSVVSIATAAMCQSGCEKLIFIGQDMCMYNYKVHADTNERALYKKLHQEKDNFVLNLKDIYGNNVASPLNYYLIKKSLEGMADIFGGVVEFINATEGGLGIKGIPNRMLAEVLNSWEEDDSQQVIEERLKEAQQIDFKCELRNCLEELDKIECLNSKIMVMMQEINDILAKNDKLLDRDKCLKIFKAAQETTWKLKEIDWYSQCVELEIASVLDSIYQYWEKGLDSVDELVKFYAISGMQLQTAQLVKIYTETMKNALKDASIIKEEIKVKK